MDEISFVSKADNRGRLRIPTELREEVEELQTNAWYEITLNEKLKEPKNSRKTVIDTSSNLGALIADKADEHDNLDNRTVEK